MAKATIVNITNFDGTNLIVQANPNTQFKVLSNQDGLLKLEAIPCCNISIDTAAKIMIGCFKQHSTFYGVKLVYFYINNRILRAGPNSKFFGIVGNDLEH